MPKTVVINRKAEPAREEVYIGRGSDWGNPFTHKTATKAEHRVENRDTAIYAYRKWILGKPELLLRLHELEGKVLGCYCKPARCHGDVLVELIENPDLYKDRIPVKKTLECSSKGDKRFSALSAKVKLFGKTKTIENWYQLSKRITDQPAPRYMKDIKGKTPDYFVVGEKKYRPTALTKWYKLLWLTYLDQNPDLVEFAKEFDEFTDMFRGKAVSCQADVIKQYVDDRPSIIKEVARFAETAGIEIYTPQPFRVIIAGGRHFDNYQLLKRKCDKILGGVKRDIVIRSGKATGADRWGEKYADESGYAVEEFPANWYPNGKSGKMDRAAGHRRNREMADGDDTHPEPADALIAFWDGKSAGTKGMIEYAEKKGLQVRVIRYDKY